MNLGTCNADGTVVGGAELPVENLQNFESFDISRWSDQNNDWVILFEGESPANNRRDRD